MKKEFARKFEDKCFDISYLVYFGYSAICKMKFYYKLIKYVELNQFLNSQFSTVKFVRI